VTFYRSADYVAAHLAAFVESGLLAGETVFVIAGAERHRHLAALLAEKRRPPFNPLNPALVCLDADDLIDEVAPGGALDLDAANDVVKRIVGSAPRVRVYGEVASRLEQQGHVASALQIEALGHRLAHEMGVSVLCGYDAAHLPRDTREADRVADLHDRGIAECPADLLAPRTFAPPLVLLADDVQDGREMYGEYLRYSGFRVITAADGAEAMRLAEVYLPDVILMDVRMPVVNGSTAMRILKADPRLVRTPIVALTAHALDDERAAMLAGGFDDVITKPCLPDRLVLAIRDVVRV